MICISNLALTATEASTPYAYVKPCEQALPYGEPFILYIVHYVSILDISTLPV